MADAEKLTEQRETLRREAWGWIVQMTSGEVSSADRAALERWCAQSPDHAEAYARAKGLWHTLGPAIEAAVPDAGRGLDRGRGMLVRPTRRAVVGALGVAAAGAAGVAVMHPPSDLWPSYSELSADHRTAVGEQRKITLADHATVELNTRTSVNVRGADRIELIAGEAAITTGPSAVEVLAANGTVSASDAQLIVRHQGSEVSVTCLGGSVRVAQQQRSVIVPLRHQVLYSTLGMGDLTAIDPEVVTGWQRGVLIFLDERLSRVISEVNRYRAGRIILMNEALGERRVSARFNLARLDAVVTQLHDVFGARVTTLPGGVVVVS